MLKNQEVELGMLFLAKAVTKNLTNRSCGNFTTLRFVKSPQLKRYKSSQGDQSLSSP